MVSLTWESSMKTQYITHYYLTKSFFVPPYTKLLPALLYFKMFYTFLNLITGAADSHHRYHSLVFRIFINQNFHCHPRYYSWISRNPVYHFYLLNPAKNVPSITFVCHIFFTSIGAHEVIPKHNLKRSALFRQNSKYRAFHKPSIQVAYIYLIKTHLQTGVRTITIINNCNDISEYSLYPNYSFFTSKKQVVW